MENMLTSVNLSEILQDVMHFLSSGIRRVRYDVPQSRLLPEQNNTVWISYPAAVSFL